MVNNVIDETYKSILLLLAFCCFGHKIPFSIIFLLSFPSTPYYTKLDDMGCTISSSIYIHDTGGIPTLGLLNRPSY